MPMPQTAFSTAADSQAIHVDGVIVHGVSGDLTVVCVCVQPIERTGSQKKKLSSVVSDIDAI